MHTSSQHAADRWIGIILVIISATAFGALPIFARVAYRTGTDPVSILFLRFSIASILMFTWILIRGIRLPRGKTLLTLVGMGAFGYAGQSFSYFTALTMAPAGTVALLLYLYPALVTILSATVLKNPPTPREILAMALSFAGIILIIGFHSGGQALGVAFGLLAACIYSFYIIIGTKATKQADSFAASAIIIAAAALVYGVAVSIRGVHPPQSLAGWGAVAGIAVVSTVLAIVTFFGALKRIGPVQTSMLSMAEPVITVWLACALLGENLTIAKVAGGTLVVVAGLLLTRRR